MDTAAVLSLAGTQHGVFSIRQAMEAGISKGAVHRSVGSGVLERLAPEVYRVRNYPWTRLGEIVAACLTYRGAASHQTAAELWDMLDRRNDLIHVITRRWDRVPRPDLVIHESRDLCPEDVVLLDGIPRTTASRTVVDLGAEVAPQAVEIAFEAGIRKHLFTFEDVESFVTRVARRGRRGVGAIRPLLRERERWDGLTESALEDRFRRLLVGQEVPPPVPQYEVRTEDGRLVCRADFAYPGRRVLIELDSERHHMDRLTFRRDRTKQNEAAVLGWVTLRYTWHDLSARPFDVVAEVRSFVSA